MLPTRLPDCPLYGWGLPQVGEVEEAVVRGEVEVAAQEWQSDVVARNLNYYCALQERNHA